MKRKMLSCLIVMAMTTFLLTGCGSTAEEAAPVQTSETVEEEEVVELNVAYMPNYGSLWSIMNAVEQGYLAEENIEVNLIEFADGPTIIAALESGSIDLGYIGQGAHKLCINGQADIFVLSHISNGDMLIGGPGVVSVKDLLGKKVAYTSGTSSEDILINSLKRADMTLDDIIAVDMDKEAVVSAMISGGVDAAAIWSPHSLNILESVEGSVKLTDNMTFSDEAVSLSSWVVMPEYAEANREILVRFTRALFKAMDYAATEHQTETAELVAKQIEEEQEIVYEQRGDAQWLTGKEVAAGAADGSVEEYYELQKKAFVAAGAVDGNLNVSDYVMLDVMIEAGEY